METNGNKASFVILSEFIRRMNYVYDSCMAGYLRSALLTKKLLIIKAKNVKLFFHG